MPGALRLAAVVFALGVVGYLLALWNASEARDVPRIIWFVLERALICAGYVFLFYLALEPYVRRRWPQTLVAWTRLLAGKLNDPLVGRDLLLGAVLGAATSALLFVSYLGVESAPPLEAAIGNLQYLSREPWRLAGNLLAYLRLNVFFPVGYLLLLSLLRALLRRDWGAIAVAACLPTALSFMSTGSLSAASVWDAFTTLIWYIALGFSITRLGLLAAISFYSVYAFLVDAPLTFEFSRWYWPYSAAIAGLFVLFTVFAFKAALGNQRLFKTDLFED